MDNANEWPQITIPEKDWDEQMGRKPVMDEKRELPRFVELNPPERSRTYIFAMDDNTVGTFRIENVVKIAISKSGTHRLEDSDGYKFIVPTGWIGIELDVDEWTF